MENSSNIHLNNNFHLKTFFTVFKEHSYLFLGKFLAAITKNWKKKCSHFDPKGGVTGGTKISTQDSESLENIRRILILTLNIESIWLIYSTMTRNPWSNFCSASDSTFWVKMTPFFLQCSNWRSPQSSGDDGFISSCQVSMPLTSVADTSSRSWRQDVR